MVQMKLAVPGVQAVVPIISDEVDLLVLFNGPLCSVPRDARIMIDGKICRIWFVAEIPERVTGIMTRSRSVGEGNNSFFGELHSTYPYIECQAGQGVHEQLCGGGETRGRSIHGADRY